MGGQKLLPSCQTLEYCWFFRF